MTANLQALAVLAELERTERSATLSEREALARYSSWGAVPEIFDETREDWTAEREQLRTLLRDEAHWAQARRTTINAHYTHPQIAAAMWDLARELGFTGGRVLEPGCGAGVFVALAPAGAEIVGVELDDTTAAIAQELHPHARVLSRSFAEYRPRGALRSGDRQRPVRRRQVARPGHNRRGHSIHNHFIVKSLALTRPGGLVVVLSSRYTLDAGNPAARREMNELGELLGAIRLPTGAHRRAAGTDALTDLLIFRRRPADTEALSESWITTQTLAIDGGEAQINAHFIEHPDRVLGQLELAHGMYGAQTLTVAGDRDPAAIAQRIAATAIRSPSAHRRSRWARPRPSPDGAQRWRRRRGCGTGISRPRGRELRAVTDGLQEPLSVPRTHHRRAPRAAGAARQRTALLSVEAQTLEDTPRSSSSAHGCRRYRAYSARMGR